MTTRIYSHPSSLDHLTPPGHPERPDRIRILSEIFGGDKFADAEHLDAPAADPELFNREPDKFRKATEALTVRQQKLEAAENEWLELAELAEEISG